MATYWRKWSRQSEELPITRILDLAILAAQGSLYFQDAYRYEKFYDPENPVVDIIGLQGNRMTVEVDTKIQRSMKTSFCITIHYKKTEN